MGLQGNQRFFGMVYSKILEQDTEIDISASQGKMAVTVPMVVVKMKLPKMGPQHIQPFFQRRSTEGRLMPDIQAESNVQGSRGFKKRKKILRGFLEDILQHEAASKGRQCFGKPLPQNQTVFDPLRPHVPVTKALIAGVTNDGFRSEQGNESKDLFKSAVRDSPDFGVDRSGRQVYEGTVKGHRRTVFTEGVCTTPEYRIIQGIESLCIQTDLRIDSVFKNKRQIAFIQHVERYVYMYLFQNGILHVALPPLPIFRRADS